MAIDKKLRIYDENGVEVDYDILAADVKFSDGESLPDKLSELEQEVEDAGQVDAIRVNGRTYTPDNKVIDLGTIEGEKGDKGDKGDQGEKGEKGDTGEQGIQGEKGDKGDTGDTGEQGPQGNSGVAGTDGITPHIDVVTGHWFIGDEDTGIPARGLQGNSGYTGAVGELEVVEDYTEGGVGKAASAEAVKDMAIKSIPEAGTFAEAYYKAKVNNVVFPWFLRDTDEDGNSIEKMIWHAGNRKFVDAIGAEISGRKNGITIVSDGNGTLELYGGGYEGVVDRNPATQPVGSRAQLHFTAGETNFDFDDIKNAFIASNQSLYDTAVANTPSATPTTMDKIYTAIKNYDGKTLACSSTDWGNSPRNSVFDVTVDSEDSGKATYVDIDFGGVVFVGATAYYGNTSDAGIIDVMSRKSNANTLVRNIKRLAVDGDDVRVFNGCTNLKNVEIQGTITKGAGICGKCASVETLDLSNLEVESTCNLLMLLDSYQGEKRIAYIDIRKFDTSSVPSFNSMFGNCANLKTIIIGNFSNAAATAVDKFLVYGNMADHPYGGVTLVCTSDTPPVLNPSYDWIANHFSTIRVPNKTVEVDGEDVTVLSLYQNAAGWSTYASIMSTYEESEY